jgi:hypothetical protein
MVATIATTAGSAVADSCFDDLARTPPPGIGPAVGTIARELAGPGTQGSTVPTADPAFLNEIKQLGCPQP